MDGHKDEAVIKIAVAQKKKKKLSASRFLN